MDGWVDAMAQAINQTEASGYFRWFDSGDLQGAWHLAKIVEVVNKTPNTRRLMFIASCLDVVYVHFIIFVELESVWLGRCCVA
jgi:hypothetical protein